MPKLPLKPLAFVAGVVGAGTLAGRLAGYKFGGNTVVRCQQGHLYTTIWIPGVKLKGLELGFARFQRCPVGQHWSLAIPVKEAALSEEERQEAASHKDIRLP
jgi:hypothetical protein